MDRRHGAVRHPRMMSLVVEPWVLLSLAAAGFQTLRFALQKALSTRLLNPVGATFARFVYSAPLIALFMGLYVGTAGAAPPLPGAVFLGFALAGGLAQVFATILVVTLFGTRNFAVGITLKKTEVLLAVLVGMLLLGEGATPLALAAILAGLFGVLLLSLPTGALRDIRRNFDGRSAALGLGAGLLFAISGVCYRGASLQVVSEDAFLRAGITLAAVTGLQMVGMALWLALRDPAQLVAVWHARRVAVWIGLLSLAGSLCWFWAFTLQVAAYVKAVGQVELILSLAVSVLLFRERFSRRELLGIAVLGLSILSLVLAL